MRYRNRTVAARLVICAAVVCLTACAGSVRPSTAPAAPRRDALLVLPGFGYNRGAEKTLRSLAPAMAAQGVDLYVADYITRSGLADSRAKLRRFIRDNQLDRYQRVHVFAFIAGAWTFNPVIETHQLPNLASVVYDRSPYQERAPQVASDDLHFLAWLRYGSTIFDVAHTPYPPVKATGVKIGLMVETVPTSFIKQHAKSARSHGPFEFACDAFAQRHDDCMFVPMNHNDLYKRFVELWPDLLAFVRTGRFTAGADRTPPADTELVVK